MTRIAPPGPSFIREISLNLHRTPNELGTPVRVGMAAPTQTDDGWWLTVLWCADEQGVIDARAAAPPAGPPPGSPLGVIGPSFAGGLSGLIAEDGGRQLVRLRLPPADDPSRPWDRPLIVQLALTWDPVRVTTMRPNELAREALEAFARAVAAVGRPG